MRTDESSSILSDVLPPQLATASVDCGRRLLSVSDAEDGEHRLVLHLHLWPRSSRSLGFPDLAGSCWSLPDLVGQQGLTGLARPGPQSKCSSSCFLPGAPNLGDSVRSWSSITFKERASMRIG